MSEPLKDFRGKITAETDAVLEAINRTTGKDKSEIAREILHAWALEQLSAARLIVRFVEGEGVSGSAEGTRGKTRERS